MIEDAFYDPCLEPNIVDKFGPVSQDSLQLKPNIEVHFISSEPDCSKLAKLFGKSVVGIDAEWRPNLTRFIKTRSALLQLSSETDVFLVDLLSLHGSA